jgi:Fe-S oxidoreductase
MNYLFAPGCALLLYKPELADAVHRFLVSSHGEMASLRTCCRHMPQLPHETCVINVCPGCDRRYRENYDQPSTVSLWELLAESDSFPFPDYGVQRMAILDACPTRDQDRIHDAVRALATRMRIDIVEPARTRPTSICCGDSFYGQLPTSKVAKLMEARAREMPADDVIVYCVSCANSVLIGGKRPHYLVDLLFGEETNPRKVEPDAWHKELDGFIEAHAEYEIAGR